MSRNRVNGILLLLVAGLGTLIWLSEPDRTENRPVPLTQLLPEHIDSIRISNQSTPDLRMQRQGEQWRMTEPYIVEANSVRIQRLLEILSSPVSTQFPIEQRDLSEFGLKPPAAVVHLNQLEIRVGATDPIKHYRYLAIGDSLYLIKDQFPHLLLAAAERFVSQQVLPSTNRLESIHTPTWQLKRTPDTAQVWQLSPVPATISMDRLIEKVDEWTNAQALKVSKAPAVALESQIEIRLQGSNTPLSFGIFREQRRGFLIRQDLGLAYELPRIDSMLAPPTASTSTY